MSWNDFFRSRYVLLLEEERKAHAQEIAELKKNHAAELERAITEANRGWAEADRLRIYLVPGLPATTRNEVPDTTPQKVTPEEIEQGTTPFQRYAARHLKQQEAEAKAAAAAKQVAEAGKTPAQPV